LLRLSRRDLAALIAAPFLLIAADRFYARQHAEASVQAQLNVRFAARPLAMAFARYPRLHPPLYPVLLWTAARAFVPPERLNEILLIGLLAGAGLVLRQLLPDRQYVIPLVAFVVFHPLYVNFHQTTAEAVFTPLLLLLAVALTGYLRGGGAGWLAAAATTLSLLGLSRYFAVPFAFPLVLAAVLLLAPVTRTRRLVHSLVVLVVAGVPIGWWMLATRMETGYWTGTDRSAPRLFPEAVRHWSELTTLGANLRLTARTLFVDFFSPGAYAAHSVVTRPYALSPVEWLTLVLVVACLVAVCRHGEVAISWAPPSLLQVSAFLAALYVALTVAIWTASNNDPIYTRFLFPVYPLLGIVAVRAYERVRLRARSRWELLPFQALLLDFLVVQLVRCWRAEALPIRYL
jgi:hypothetical protein